MKRSYNKKRVSQGCLIVLLVIVMGKLLTSDGSIKPTGDNIENPNQTFHRQRNISNESTQDYPRFAFFLTGTKGDGESLIRLLYSLYHPQNRYLLHLDSKATDKEWSDLARVRENGFFDRVGNVDILRERNDVTYRGISMLANYLHGAAWFLANAKFEWDWFINLSASDYPLVTPDDFIFAMSNVSRNFNFVAHYPATKMKLKLRAKPIYLDKAIWDKRPKTLKRTQIFRTLPKKFKIFTGSAWVVLSRDFVEYLTVGYENFPRILLLYFSNYASSPESYFHTLVCNSRFRETVVNSDFHFIVWNETKRQHPLFLMKKNFDEINSTWAPFARKFKYGEKVLDLIDSKFLGRFGGFSPGGWCLESCGNIENLKIRMENYTGNSTLATSKRVLNFQENLSKLILNRKLGENICRFSRKNKTISYL